MRYMNMIQIQHTLLSRDIFEIHFLCDLSKCKGQCCIEGASGAPLTREEVAQINDILPIIWHELSAPAQQLINKQGIVYSDVDGEMVTSIINGKECIFTYTDADGVCKCVIDTAYRENRIPVQKPISCHLYPIRLREYDGYTAVNYDRWSVCQSAVRLGRKKNVPLYQFLQEPLIRRFGKEWYEEVCLVATQLDCVR